jgi:hypothetical protein
MASLRQEIVIDADPATVWDAVRDVHAAHERLTPGVLVDARADGDHARRVTFAAGFSARELIVDVDDGARRLAYAVVDSPMAAEHHHATMQVVPDGDGSRLVWICDVLPDTLAAHIGPLMEAGGAAMRATLRRAGTG